MFTVTTTPSISDATDELLEDRLCRLAANWQADVAHHSSTTLRHAHPAYQEIIRLGPCVVPWLLRDLEQHHTHWFHALRQITGVNPVPETAAGHIEQMVQAWTSWARKNGYSW